jgi:hypothetical protein
LIAQAYFDPQDLMLFFTAVPAKNENAKRLKPKGNRLSGGRISFSAC